MTKWTILCMQAWSIQCRQIWLYTYTYELQSYICVIVKFIQKSEESGICTTIWKKTSQIGERILSDITRYYKSINGAKKTNWTAKCHRACKTKLMPQWEKW